MRGSILSLFSQHLTPELVEKSLIWLALPASPCSPTQLILGEEKVSGACAEQEFNLPLALPTI